MKKFLLLSLLTVSSVFTCSAQSTPSGGKFSVGFDVAIPVSDYDNYYMTNLYKYGIGGSLKFDVPTLLPDFFITLSGGITTFKASDATLARIQEMAPGDRAKSEDYIPLKLGLKYYHNGFFVEAQAGGVLHTGPTVQYFSDSDFRLALSPGIGYAFNNGIEIGARYEYWKTGGSSNCISQFGIRLAYAFKLPARQ